VAGKFIDRVACEAALNDFLGNKQLREHLRIV